MFKFENERQSGVKCVNVHCQFCMDDPGIVCDSVNGSSGDPSYADCLTYLPEKLIDNIEKKLTSTNAGSPKLPQFMDCVRWVEMKRNGGLSDSENVILLEMHNFIERQLQA